MATISRVKLKEIRRLYYRERLSMREIAEIIGVPINAVVYFMRKNKLRRRSFSEINELRFEKKAPSFNLTLPKTVYSRELKAIGTMLYWGEGYKAGKNNTVDFANSDPDMVIMFLRFLRKIYRINENKLRVLLYCYADQNVNELIRFWSNLTKIPKKQFTKPYVKKDFRKNGRKMQHGLVHIRYSDKKLLLQIKKDIILYIGRYARYIKDALCYKKKYA